MDNIELTDKILDIIYLFTAVPFIVTFFINIKKNAPKIVSIVILIAALTIIICAVFKIYHWK